jgi:hypothetical protein
VDVGLDEINPVKLSLEKNVNQKKLIAIPCLLLLVMSLGSCGKPANLPGTIFSETSTAFPVIHVTSLIPTSFTPVSTIRVITSSPTATISPKVTPTVKITSTITPTFIPTLSIEEAQLRLNELLANNGDCLLPCLWNIIPGASTSQDGQVLLEPLSGISLFTSFDSGQGTISLLNILDDLSIVINVGYLTYPNNEVINYIGFEARAMQEMTEDRGLVHVFDSGVFGDLFSIYMLPHVLSEYGPPFSVLISTLAEPLPQERGGDTGDFRMILLYPDQGILVNYKTNIHVVGENVAGCLNNAHVVLELYPSGNGESFISNLYQSLREDIQNNFKPIEEVTALSIDSFYEEYSHPTDVCLETPANLWPMPER